MSKISNLTFTCQNAICVNSKSIFGPLYGQSKCLLCNGDLIAFNAHCDCSFVFKRNIVDTKRPYCIFCNCSIGLNPNKKVQGDTMATRSKKPVLGTQAKDLFQNPCNETPSTQGVKTILSEVEEIKTIPIRGTDKFFKVIQQEPKVDILDAAKEAVVSEASDAVWRVAADQYLETAKTPVMAAFYSGIGLEGKNKSSGLAREYIGKFLESDLGDALFTYALSFSTEFLPYQKPIAKRVARELRIKALALLGNKVVNTFMNPMRNALDVSIRGLNILEA